MRIHGILADNALHIFFACCQVPSTTSKCNNRGCSSLLFAVGPLSPLPAPPATVVVDDVVGAEGTPGKGAPDRNAAMNSLACTEVLLGNNNTATSCTRQSTTRRRQIHDGVNKNMVSVDESNYYVDVTWPCSPLGSHTVKSSTGGRGKGSLGQSRSSEYSTRRALLLSINPHTTRPNPYVILLPNMNNNNIAEGGRHALERGAGFPHNYSSVHR